MSQEAKVLTGIGIFTIIIIGVAVFLFGGKGSLDKSQAAPIDQSILVHKDSHIEKSKNNKVTLIEFGDFQCPACGATYPIVQQILNAYKDDVTFVFKNYPLPIHQNSRIAAEAAEAAGAQGKFFPMYEKLYDNQKDWGESKDPMKYFEQYAKQIKLNVDTFKKEVADQKYEKKIQADIDDGNKVGLNATPTFYINGVEIVGGLPYDQFKQKIDDAIKQKK